MGTEKPRHKNRRLGLLGTGVVLLGASITFAALTLFVREAPTAAVADVITYSTDTPDQTKPDESYEWKGAPSDPKKVIIPSIGVNAYIQNVGVDQNGEIAVPNNLHLGGWFVDSARPGEKGLSIIDGHVDFRPHNIDAVFQYLADIKEGAEVAIMFGDDTMKKFTVVQVKDVTLQQAAEILFSSLPGAERQLNLITCAGIYDEASGRLDRRIIVAAVPL